MITPSLRRASSVIGLLACVLALCAFGPEAAPPGQPPPPATKPAPAEAPLEYVLMSTSKGDIVLELNRAKAPVTVANFLSYVDKEHFNGTIFHRIMKEFMIQGGGFTADMNQKPTDPPIKLESNNGLSNARGTIAMARTNVPDSATSQFFINTVDNARTLDATGPNTGYAVFGKVVAGMKTVDAIRTVPVVSDPRGEMSKPQETVTIQKIKRLTADEAKKLIEAETAGGGATTQPR